MAFFASPGKQPFPRPDESPLTASLFPQEKALREAVKAGDVETARALLEKGATVEEVRYPDDIIDQVRATLSKGQSCIVGIPGALSAAILRHDQAMVDLLWSHADPSMHLSHLESAVKGANLEVIDRILAAADLPVPFGVEEARQRRLWSHGGESSPEKTTQKSWQRIINAALRHEGPIDKVCQSDAAFDRIWAFLDHHQVSELCVRLVPFEPDEPRPLPLLTDHMGDVLWKATASCNVFFAWMAAGRFEKAAAVVTDIDWSNLEQSRNDALRAGSLNAWSSIVFRAALRFPEKKAAWASAVEVWLAVLSPDVQAGVSLHILEDRLKYGTVEPGLLLGEETTSVARFFLDHVDEHALAEELALRTGSLRSQATPKEALSACQAFNPWACQAFNPWPSWKQSPDHDASLDWLVCLMSPEARSILTDAFGPRLPKSMAVSTKAVLEESLPRVRVESDDASLARPATPARRL